MKVQKYLLMPVALLIAGMSLVGCSNSGDPSTLNVVCLNLGYGREWIDEAVKIWEDENPGYKVKLEASPDARSIITSDIAKRNNPDDVYISNGTDWRKYAGQNKLLALDDFLNDKVDGMTVLDKINPEYLESIYFKDPSNIILKSISFLNK